MSNNREWVPDEAVEALTVRRALQRIENPTQLATDLLKEALPLVTMSMTHLAIYCPVDAIRFQASRYIMEKTIGDSKDLKLPDNRPAWERIYESVLEEVDDVIKKGE